MAERSPLRTQRAVMAQVRAWGTVLLGLLGLAAAVVAAWKGLRR